MQLEGKTAVVTGGGGFIGKAIAARLGAAGAKLALLDVNGEALESARAELSARGVAAEGLVVDIGDAAAVAGTMRRIAERFGGPGILVNCAGGSARKEIRPFRDQSMEVVERILRINLMGTLHCTHAALPYMVARNYGKIVNLSSVIGLRGKEGCVDYAAAKGAIIAVTCALAKELGQYNINVNSVAPGLVNREPVADEQAFARKTTYLNRACTGGDVAELVYFLVSPASDFITGQNHVVDGGRSLHLKGDA